MPKKKAGRKAEKSGVSSSGGGGGGSKVAYDEDEENDKTISFDFTWLALALVVIFVSLKYGHEGGVEGSIAELTGMFGGGGGGGVATADAAKTPGATKGKRSRKKGGPPPIEVEPCGAEPSHFEAPIALAPPLESFSAEHNASLLWGHYRPSVYWGLRTRSWPAAAGLGLIWGRASVVAGHADGAAGTLFRHECREDDGVAPFGFDRHDGRSFARQKLTDAAAGIELTTHFAKPQLLEGSADATVWSNAPVLDEQLEWVARIASAPLPSGAASAGPPLSVMLYVGFDCDGVVPEAQCIRLPGGASTSALEVKVTESNALVVRATSSAIFGSTMGAPTPTEWQLEILSPIGIGPSRSTSAADAAAADKYGDYTPAWSWRGIASTKWADVEGLVRPVVAPVGEPSKNRTAKAAKKWVARVAKKQAEFFDGTMDERTDTVLIHLRVDPSQLFQLDMVMTHSPEEEEAEPSTCTDHTGMREMRDWITSAITAHSEAFDARFEATWGLEAAGLSGSALEMGRFAQSNLLGGMGYFAGRNRLKDPAHAGRESFTTALFTATPSRSFFPRGFAWDEGFHQLLVHRWDLGLSADALSHWLGTLHGASEATDCAGGWIPREQVLGEAARRRVPAEFLQQDVTVTNPPTLLLLLETMTRYAEDVDGSLPEAERKSARWLLNTLVPQYLYPRARAWLDWIVESQAVDPAMASSTDSGSSAAFRWRGRDPDEPKLMPTNFASGLDDYPRALFPSADEEHLDLLCWVAQGAGLMARLAERLIVQAGEPGGGEPEGGGGGGGNSPSVETLRADAARYSAIRSSAVSRLMEVHWSDADGAFFDLGWTFQMPSVERPAVRPNEAAPPHLAHLVQDVMVACGEADGDGQKQVAVPYNYVAGGQRGRDRQERQGCPRSHPRFLWPLGGSGGKTPDNPQGLDLRQRAVANGESRDPLAPTRRMAEHIGYVTIFPLLLTLLDPRAHEFELRCLMDIMRDRKQLWSNHGLRSLSAHDLFYRQPNAPGDEPYWRGAIWMPINFLALRALKHYAAHPGAPAAIAKQAASLYAELRENLLNTCIGEWDRTGSIWEHYDDVGGRGLRSHPFTGWTALVLNVMSEKYSV